MVDPISLRRLRRREYFRQYAEHRRAAARDAGARRIDVTLQGDDLERLERIAQWLDNSPRRSDPEIIRAALRLAVDALEGKGAMRPKLTPAEQQAWDDARATPGILLDADGNVLYDGEAEALGAVPFKTRVEIDAAEARLQALLAARRKEREAEEQ